MIGIGYDIHRLSANESLILGGIKIESNKGTIAHSDGDVLIHSIIDAILGAAGLGDIGDHFPDTDAKYKNIDSTELLLTVNRMIHNECLQIVNIDISIVLEFPKLFAYKNKIKDNLARILEIDVSKINVKATTNEKQDSVGANNSVVVYSVCELKKY
jgi:2-C-methyl-D-erythritol 2,4-cyclodiphosphate synthase